MRINVKDGEDGKMKPSVSYLNKGERREAEGGGRAVSEPSE